MSKPDFSSELVPLADRLRVMQIARTVLAVIVAAHALAARGAWAADVSDVAVICGAFLALTTAGYVMWQRWPGRGITLFGAMLIADGVFIGGLSALSGGVFSPVTWLALPHCMMVALLASYRSAAKIALWHGLVATGLYHASNASLLPELASPIVRPESAAVALGTLTVLTWVAALGTASFGAMNERELRRRKVDLEDLARMAAALESVSTAQAVGEVLAHSLADAYGFASVAVIAYTDDRLVPLCGPIADPSAPAAIDEVIARAWASRTTQLVAKLDVRANPHLAIGFADHANLLVTPLFAEGRPLGVVVAEHGLRRGSRIERRVIAMVERFCAHGSLALTNAWLVEELQQFAAVDALTGIANRRTFELRLEQELRRAARQRSSVALVMVDVDRFKVLNDTYGHRTGDEVLKQVAAVLARESREYDVVARYGGEEFAIVLPDCSEHDAAVSAERMRLAVAQRPEEPGVTASFGVAVAADPGTVGARDALVRSADAALYSAKRDGRDRVARASSAVGARE